MWNTTNNSNKTSINIPATGIVQKSNQKSFFLRMQNGSELSKEIFTKEPMFKGNKVAILQILLIGDWFIIELVDESEI